MEFLGVVELAALRFWEKERVDLAYRARMFF